MPKDAVTLRDKTVKLEQKCQMKGKEKNLIIKFKVLNNLIRRIPKNKRYYFGSAFPTGLSTMKKKARTFGRPSESTVLSFRVFCLFQNS
jgi:hypothetical protein